MAKQTKPPFVTWWSLSLFIHVHSECLGGDLVGDVVVFHALELRSPTIHSSGETVELGLLIKGTQKTNKTNKTHKTAKNNCWTPAFVRCGEFQIPTKKQKNRSFYVFFRVFLLCQQANCHYTQGREKTRVVAQKIKEAILIGRCLSRWTLCDLQNWWRRLNGCGCRCCTCCRWRLLGGLLLFRRTF